MKEKKTSLPVLDRFVRFGIDRISFAQNELLKAGVGSHDGQSMARILADTGTGGCRISGSISMLMTVGSVVFRPEDPRDVRFKAHLCMRYMDHRDKTMAARACGLCVMACDAEAAMLAGGGQAALA